MTENSVWRCGMNERKYYEAYEERYHQVHSRDLNWFMEKPSEIVGDVLRRYGIGKEEKLLELGCGEGRDAGVLLKLGYDMLATDISDASVNYCKKKFPDHAEKFSRLDCVTGQLANRFDFIYAVAVIHMLVLDQDRAGFYRFIREHLSENGIGLICTMGDGTMECCSDISTAFALQERVHEQSGKTMMIAGTSYRAVSFQSFRKELKANGLKILEEGFTDMKPDYYQMMYAVVKRD